MLRKKQVFFFSLLVILLVLLTSGIYFGLGQRNYEYSSEEFLMDTLVSIKASGANPALLKEAVTGAFAEMRRLEQLTDRFPAPGTNAFQISDVCRINEAAGSGPVKVDQDVFAMLLLSRRYYGLTQGTFDITIGPVMDVWGFGKPEQTVPSSYDLQKALSLVNGGRLLLDEQERTAFLQSPGMSVDLGAVVKGYAVEKAARFLEEHGVERALVNAGGNIRTIGKNKEGSAWKIGIQDPRNGAELVGILSLEDESAVTSGDYNRFFTSQGVRYHHLISPHTGYPVNKNMSVTVVTHNGGQADILSTALFLLDPEEALRLAEELEETEAFLVTADQRILVTSGLRGKVEVKQGGGYRYDKS